MYPPADKSNKLKRRRLVQEIPYNLTSQEALCKMALKQLDTIRKFADKEKAAKAKYEKQLCKKSAAVSNVNKSVAQKQKGSKKARAGGSDKIDKDFCMGCHMSWQEDEEIQSGFLWIQCDQCEGWIHKDCCPDSLAFIVDDDSPFLCPECELSRAVSVKLILSLPVLNHQCWLYICILLEAPGIQSFCPIYSHY